MLRVGIRVCMPKSLPIQCSVSGSPTRVGVVEMKFWIPDSTTSARHTWGSVCLQLSGFYPELVGITS